jgi:CDP-diacylglycerol--glycerol-3-phosphate 3-phosphatidyltransferase
MTATAPTYTGSWISSPANVLTVSRLVVAPFLFWVILEADATRGTSWTAFGLGVVLGLTDYLDGPVARRSGAITRSGAFLDPLADKVVVVGAAVCFVSVDRLHWLPVAIVAAREVGISLVRVYWARQSLAMPARRSAKYKTLVQGLALVLAAMPILEDAQGAIEAAWWVAVAFTVYTGLQYVLDGRSATSTTGSL